MSKEFKLGKSKIQITLLTKLWTSWTLRDYILKATRQEQIILKFIVVKLKYH